MFQVLTNVFQVFTKRVHKLKQCTNLRLHDVNCTSLVVSLLVHEMGGGEGGAYSRRGAYFKNLNISENSQQYFSSCVDYSGTAERVGLGGL